MQCHIVQNALLHTAFSVILPAGKRVFKREKMFFDTFQILIKMYNIMFSAIVGNIIVNVICQYCFNKKYKIDDPELQHIIRYVGMIFAGLAPGEPLSVMPWLRFFPDSEKIKKLKEGARLQNEHIQYEFDEHRRTFDPNNIRDITDRLIHLSQSEEVCFISF